MKRLFFLFFSLTAFSPSQALAEAKDQEEDSEKKTGYGYVVKNYFSKRNSEQEWTQKLALYAGMSIYRESREKTLPPFSSFIAAFEQRLKEFPKVGDLSLQIGVHSAKLTDGRSTAIEFGPRFSLPSGKNKFPFYTGVGMGLGLFPRHIIKNKPALSFNAQVFAGFRFAGLHENLGLMTELNLQMRAPFSDLQIYMDLFVLGGLLFSF